MARPAFVNEHNLVPVVRAALAVGDKAAREVILAAVADAVDDRLVTLYAEGWEIDSFEVLVALELASPAFATRCRSARREESDRIADEMERFPD